MKAKHEPCTCGCGELADECMSGGHPMAAFTVRQAVGSAAQMGSFTDAATRTSSYGSDNDQSGETNA